MNKANERLLLASHVRRLSERGKRKAEAVTAYLAFTESGRVPTVPGQNPLVTLWHVFIGATEYARFWILTKGGA